MIVGIGVTLMITGLLCYAVVDNFRPHCAAWKRKVINWMIGTGAVIIIAGTLV